MSEPLSAATLTAIEARVEAATPGPWSVESDANEIGDASGFGIWTSAEIVFGTWYEDNGLYGGAGLTLFDEATAKFVAAARTDIPLLLAEVHRLRGLIGENGETK